jgi:hypothetical protein
LPLVSVTPEERQALRLRSILWACTAGLAAGLVGLSGGLEPALRAAGCGFFYGLLAFHLQRVDPDDGHLQAGLVGAVCAIRSLASPWVPQGGLSTVMMDALRTWPPLWLPVIAAALWLQGAQRCLPSLRP